MNRKHSSCDLLRMFVDLSSTKYHVCKFINLVTSSAINSFKITIRFFIFPKTVFVVQIILLQQLIKTKNQAHKSLEG